MWRGQNKKNVCHGFFAFHAISNIFKPKKIVGGGGGQKLKISFPSCFFVCFMLLQIF